MIDVSIIIPVYYNVDSIQKTIEVIKSEVINNNKDLSFEIICIDDGSKDGSYEKLLEISDNNSSLLKIIKFSRNFGQVQALLAGYKTLHGKCAINISADLQDPPELMNDMIRAFFIENVQIVIATREDREESFYRKKTSQTFYWMMRKLSFSEMPTGGFDYALISKKVCDEILKNHDANPFWQGQILWTGYPVKFLKYKRRKREIGKSKWTFGKKIKYLIDGVLGYSYLPLRAISLIGGVLFLLGIFYAGFIVISYFLGDTPFKGWAPIMILLLTLFGIVMLMLGIIGEYLWRVLDQVRNRSGYIIEEKHGLN